MDIVIIIDTAVNVSIADHLHKTGVSSWKSVNPLSVRYRPAIPKVQIRATVL